MTNVDMAPKINPDARCTRNFITCEKTQIEGGGNHQLYFYRRQARIRMSFCLLTKSSRDSNSLKQKKRMEMIDAFDMALVSCRDDMLTAEVI